MYAKRELLYGRLRSKLRGVPEAFLILLLIQAVSFGAAQTPHAASVAAKTSTYPLIQVGGARLRIVLEGVEEFRFQRRPGPSMVRIKEVRLGVFNGVFYLNLDAYADDVPPALHDFRASDAFIASRSFAWEIVPPKPPPAAS